MIRFYAAIMFCAGSVTDALVDSAAHAQSLTDRGVWIGLLIVLIVLLIWFARLQFSKEAALIERLAKVSENATEVMQEHTLAIQSLKMTLETVLSEVRDMEKNITEFNRRFKTHE